MDFLLIIAIIVVIALVAVLIIQQNKVKAVLNDIEKDRNALEEKEKILLKEAKIRAIEEALVDYLKENSDGNYQKIECIDGQVNMVATQEEIEYWKGYVEKHIDDQKAVLTGINQKYDMCCNDSYNTINMYYDQELSFKKAFSCVGKTAIYCAMYQILDGNPDYSIYLNIYNVDTGKLVVGGNLMNEEVSYTDEDWEKTF